MTVHIHQYENSDENEKQCFKNIGGMDKQIDLTVIAPIISLTPKNVPRSKNPFMS